MDLVAQGDDMKVLDACCGSRMFWFDKEFEDAVFMDKRTLETTLCDGRSLIVNPDVIGDFRNMPFDDESFHLVIFDPPHLLHVGDTSFLKLKYGVLEGEWQQDIKQGLEECWRVLKSNGTMVFKWNEEQVSFSMVKKLLPSKPIIGQRRGKTIWLVFFKNGSE